jgi:hypothetical protein
VSDAYLRCALDGGGFSAADANLGDCGGVEERDVVKDDDDDAADVGRRISDDIADFSRSWIDSSSAAFFTLTSRLPAPSEFGAAAPRQCDPQPPFILAMLILMLVLGVLIRLLASLASSLRSREEVDEEVLLVVLGLFGCVTWAAAVVAIPSPGRVFFSRGVSAVTESEGLEPKTGLPRGWESHICTRRLGPELASSCPSTIREAGMDMAPGCL